MDFLATYLDYHRAQTDSPDVFGEFCGLAALAAAMGSGRFLPWGSGHLRMNLWIMLVAPSTAFRKSTAISIAARVLARAEGTVYPNDWSTEGLLSVLQEKPAGMFAWREYRAAAGMMAREFNAGAKATLADLYDCPDEYRRRTVKGGDVCVTAPAITVLAGTNMDWFRDAVEANDAESGWLARFVPVIAPSRCERDYPEPPEVDPVLHGRVIAELGAAHRWTGPFQVTAEARSAMIAWSAGAKRRAEAPGPASSSLFRLITTARKFAMLSASSRCSPAIEAFDVQRAIWWADRVTEWTLTIFESDLAGGKWAALLARLLRIFAENPNGISRATIQRALRRPVRLIDDLLKALEKEGTVTRMEKASAESGKPEEWWVRG